MVTIYIEFHEGVETGDAASEILADFGSGRLIEQGARFAYVEIDDFDEVEGAWRNLMDENDYVVSWSDTDTDNADLEIDF